ncbi:hypothetical protein TNCV_5093111 [Trichonephila clavipes]|nr:hypothetical protein TNCV_5093111 [Trichonephila clavipes]
MGLRRISSILIVIGGIWHTPDARSNVSGTLVLPRDVTKRISPQMEILEKLGEIFLKFLLLSRMRSCAAEQFHSEVNLEALNRRAPKNSKKWQRRTEGDVSERRSTPAPHGHG